MFVSNLMLEISLFQIYNLLGDYPLAPYLGLNIVIIRIIERPSKDRMNINLNT